MKGYGGNIEADSIANNNFRKVIYTGKNSQLVLMSIPVGGEIGNEVHEDTDQFIRLEQGQAKAILNNGETEYQLGDGGAVFVPAGNWHNIVNTGEQDLKLYTLYAPPHHRDGVVHATKEDADGDDEHFDGTTTE